MSFAVVTDSLAGLPLEDPAGFAQMVSSLMV